MPPDEDLVAHDLIVVARWNPTNTVTRREETTIRSNGVGLIVAQERFTTIEVIRTIKGSIKPGHHRIKIEPPTEFNFEYSGEYQDRGVDPATLMSGTSNYHGGAVDNVTVPCLWFLSRARSWWKTDTTLYPTLTTVYGVQPLSREEQFTKWIKEKESLTKPSTAPK